MGVTVNR